MDGWMDDWIGMCFGLCDLELFLFFFLAGGQEEHQDKERGKRRGEKGKMNSNNKFLTLFFVCLVFSLWSNSSTKLLMKELSFPITVTMAHFLVSSVIGWAFGLVVGHIIKRNTPESHIQNRGDGTGNAAADGNSNDDDDDGFMVDLVRSRQQTSRRTWFIDMFPLVLCYTVGFLSTNISFQLVELSFSLTIKSAEPLCTALLSWMLMGETYSIAVYTSLFSIVAGVILASASELSFTMIGFVCAWMSNFALASRSVLNKIVQLNQKQTVQNQQEHAAALEGEHPNSKAMMWAQIKIDIDVLTECNSIAFLLTVPIFFFLEYDDVSIFLASVDGETFDHLVHLTIISGVFFQLYNMFSLMILSITTPLTHVVAVSVRRVIVIIFSIVYFGNRVTLLNWMGMTIVFISVFWYNLLLQRPSSGRSSGRPSSIVSSSGSPVLTPSVLRAQNQI